MTNTAPKTAKIYYINKDGTIAFRSERQSGEVRIPNYVYDLWLPLLGIEAIGVYSVYCRLEREESVKKVTQDRLAKLCHIGKAKLRAINVMLQACGFIEVKPPKGIDRANHFTTEIVVKDPPAEVDSLLVRRYQPASGYEPLTTWLCQSETVFYSVEPSPEVPNRTSRSSKQNVQDVPDGTSISLQPLYIADSSTDVDDIASKSGQSNPVPTKKPRQRRAAAKTAKPNPNQDLHDALVRAFGHDPAKMTPSGDRKYWVATAELAAVGMTVALVPGLYKHVEAKARAGSWSHFTVMALSTYANEFLDKRDAKPRSPLDGLNLVNGFDDIGAAS